MGQNLPVVPHLFRNMSGIKEEKLKPLLSKISAIEVYNSCSLPKTNLKTATIAKKYHLGGTGGSDSHEPSYAGNGYTLVDTTDLTIETILTDQNSVLTVSSYQKDVFGIKDLVLSTPVVVNREGVVRRIPMRLDENEQQLLRVSASVIRSEIDKLSL